MKKLCLMITAVLTLASCHKSLEDRAVQEAEEYTRKYCPTPLENSSRTDSVIFDRDSRTYKYYCTLADQMDDRTIINKYSKMLNENLLKSLKESTNIKAYKEAGFNFEYICHSMKNPKEVLYRVKFTQKDYTQPSVSEK